MKKYIITFKLSSLGWEEKEEIQCFNRNEAKNYLSNKILFLLEDITKNKKERLAFLKELCYTIKEG